MAERWDIVVDFAPFSGQNVTIMNKRDFQTNQDYAATDRVLQFCVGSSEQQAARRAPRARPARATGLSCAAQPLIPQDT